MSKVVFLIGMSGAGKTEWGKRIAERYKLPFFDIDHYLEAKESKTITGLFKEHGEQGFRKMESDALREIVLNNTPPFLLSCGGGTPIDPANFAFIKEHGVVIYLKATIPTILENLKEYIATRPMLTNGVVNPTARLKELYEKRKRVYEQADYSFQVEQLSVEDIAPVIAALTQRFSL